ncbi:MAG: peptidoglycan-binding protein [Deltaproteobacteria bacterium]|nr:peptidoglycan-binding protein [Deltaproteobacteria bacterium]
MKNRYALLSTLSVGAAVLLGASLVWAQTGGKETSGSGVQREERGTQTPGGMESSGPAQREQRGTQTQTGMESQRGAGMERGRMASSEDIKKAQEALKEKGHDPGPVDGIMGPRTQAALRAFQQAQGLKASGTLDNETKKALGLEESRGTEPRTERGKEPGPAREPGPGESPAAPKGGKE